MKNLALGIGMVPPPAARGDACERMKARGWFG